MDANCDSRRADRQAIARADGGGALVEFALLSLVLYLILAGTISIGQAVFSAQVIQDAARVAAREIALVPLPPDATFEEALNHPDVKSRVYNSNFLVIDLDQVNQGGSDLDAVFAGLPIVNQMLRPAMIYEEVAGRRLFRYPGALLALPGTPTGLTVAIPRVVSRGAEGVETIEWLPVVEEIRVDSTNPATGPFSVSSGAVTSGIVAVRVNYPYQSASLSGFQQNPAGLFEPNGNNIIVAADDGVTVSAQSAPPPGIPVELGETTASSYAGRYGLGRQLAFGKTVRPFRKLLSGQAIYRREIFASDD